MSRTRIRGSRSPPTPQHIETWCEVKDADSNDRTLRSVVLHIDKTSPSVGAVTGRPPDYGGWFNHPVAVLFQGSDATSGVASCSSSTYAGPDAVGAVVSGTCQDVAGNVGTGSFALNYDATPPAPPSVDAMPGNRRVRVTWTTSPDATSQVVRFSRKRAPVVIYQGTGDGDNRSIAPERAAISLCGHADRPGRQPGCSSGQHRPDRVAAAAALRGPANQADERRHVSATARVEDSWKDALLQRPGVPWRSQGPERLAEAASAKTRAALDLPRNGLQAHRGPLLLARLARLRQALGASVRETTGCELFSHGPLRSMRALAPIAVVLVAALAAPSASAQGGGVTAPQSGGVPAPDPAPERAAPEPDAAPGADSAPAAPTPQVPPAPSAPETSALAITSEPATSQPSAVPRAGQSARRDRRERAARQELRKERKARQRHRRSTAGRPSPASVFGMNVALVGAAGSDTRAESHSVELIALALLTLVLAAAALLVLTARISRMEGLLAPIRPDAGWLRRGLQTSRLSPRTVRRRPAS